MIRFSPLSQETRRRGVYGPCRFCGSWDVIVYQKGPERGVALCCACGAKG